MSYGLQSLSSSPEINVGRRPWLVSPVMYAGGVDEHAAGLLEDKAQVAASPTASTVGGLDDDGRGGAIRASLPVHHPN